MTTEVSIRLDSTSPPEKPDWTAYVAGTVFQYLSDLPKSARLKLLFAIVPMVLITLFRALTERYDKHKKLAKITFPLWLYVAATGVLVYVFISPCY